MQLTLLMSAPLSTVAADLGGATFLKISAYDQKAVVKTADGEMQMVAVGDKLDEQTTIVEIVTGRVVLERMNKEGKETIIVRLDGGRQQVESIRSWGENPSLMTAPTEAATSEERSSAGYR